VTYARDTRVIVATIDNGDQPGTVRGPDPTIPYIRLDRGGALCFPIDRIRPETPRRPTREH
jgi:hypothetical protein